MVLSVWVFESGGEGGHGREHGMCGLCDGGGVVSSFAEAM